MIVEDWKPRPLRVHCFRMTRGDRSSHLTASSLHVRFEALMAHEFGPQEVRRMVSPTSLRRSRPHDPATPVAWAAAAASRVAAGATPGAVVASLGDLGVFCAALGSVALLTTVPSHVRAKADLALPDSTPVGWLRDDLVVVDAADLPQVRERLETADPIALRTWTVALLPMVVDVFARQAPRWWRIRRPRFAQMVLHRLAQPEA
jgi:hypothetical protein